MDTTDGIPLEDHRYFAARLNHMESQHPVALLSHLERGTLTEHVRKVTSRAMQTRADLVFNQKLSEEQADELVMNQVVADPQEASRLVDPTSRAKLRQLLGQYRAELPTLPRTYLSESETTK